MPFQAISMEEFISTLEEGSGQSLQWFRDEWLNRRGVPWISLKSNIREEGGAYHITCTLEQLGQVYHLPIEIGIETTGGTKLNRVLLSEREATFSFESKEKPKRIVLDPNNWIIMNKIYR